MLHLVLLWHKSQWAAESLYQNILSHVFQQQKTKWFEFLPHCYCAAAKPDPGSLYIYIYIYIYLYLYCTFKNRNLQSVLTDKANKARAEKQWPVKAKDKTERQNSKCKTPTIWINATKKQ